MTDHDAQLFHPRWAPGRRSRSYQARSGTLRHARPVERRPLLPGPSARPAGAVVPVCHASSALPRADFNQCHRSGRQVAQRTASSHARGSISLASEGSSKIQPRTAAPTTPGLPVSPRHPCANCFHSAGNRRNDRLTSLFAYGTGADHRGAAAQANRGESARHPNQPPGYIFEINSAHDGQQPCQDLACFI